MVVDQDRIKALLSEAQGLAEEAGADQPEPAPATVTPPPRRIADASAQVARTLKIRVPVIAQLASRRMTISAVRKLSLGMIIEFHKGVDEPLELLINNHPIGRGDAVKVGEHFGLRVAEIHDAATRIKSMGR